MYVLYVWATMFYNIFTTSVCGWEIVCLMWGKRIQELMNGIRITTDSRNEQWICVSFVLLCSIVFHVLFHVLFFFLCFLFVFVLCLPLFCFCWCCFYSLEMLTISYYDIHQIIQHWHPNTTLHIPSQLVILQWIMIIGWYFGNRPLSYPEEQVRIRWFICITRSSYILTTIG